MNIYTNIVSIDELGKLFRNEVESLNLTNLTIVAHSMGGLVSRSFMNQSVNGLKGGELVEKLITLGTPHHGSPMANGPIRFTVDYNNSISSFIDTFDTFFFLWDSNAPSFFQYNRSDMHWDNYDNLFNYSLFNYEKNNWLISLNSNTEFDNKIIAYGGIWNGFNGSDGLGNTFLAYEAGLYVMGRLGVLKLNPGMSQNDGIVPLSSALFYDHEIKATRKFNSYNHSRMALGNEEYNDNLFKISLKSDLSNTSFSTLVTLPSNELIFEDTQVNEIQEKIITINNSGTTNINISKIEINGTNISEFEIINSQTSNLVLHPGKDLEINIRFKPISSGDKNAYLKIQNDSDNMPDCAISLSGSGTNNLTNTLSVSPENTLDYGAININSTLTKTVYVANTGNADINISNIEVLGENSGDFKIVSPSNRSFTITGGATQEIEIQFAPMSEGDKSASLYIENNSENENPEKIISLGGTAKINDTKLLLISPDYSYDFGSVTLNLSVNKTFTLTNAGNSELNVSSIEIIGENSSDFEIISPSNSSFTIAGGAKQEIKIQFTPTAEGGKSATLYIENDSENEYPEKLILLNGLGTINPTYTLSVSPENSLDYGEASINSSLSKSVYVTNTGNTEITISNIVISGMNSDDFEIMSPSSSSFILAGGATQEIEIQFEPMSEGDKSASLHIENDSENESPEKIISLSGTGTSNDTKILLVNPDNSYDFGSVTLNSNIQKSFILTNAGNSELYVSNVQITGVNSNNFEIISPSSKSFRIADGNSQELKIQFTPSTEGGKSATLYIENDSENEYPDKVISLIGNGTGDLTKSLSINPEYSLDFGTLYSNSSVEKSILLTNTGTTSISISNMKITSDNDGDFSIISPSNNSFNIAAGNTEEVMVRFTPTEKGSHSASIIINNDATNLRAKYVLGLIAKVEIIDSISFLDKKIIIIYPNPTTGMIMIEGLPDKPADIRLLDINGRLIQQWNDVSTDVELDISGVSPGNYFIQIPELMNKAQMIIKK